MIPKIIHLIWIGESTPLVDEIVVRHRNLNPDHTVILHRDDSELHEGYRRQYDTVAQLLPLKADLLRWSLLEKYGGWYFDIDCVPYVGVKQIEEEMQLDGSKILLTLRHGFPNNDIMAVAPGWPVWPKIHNYLENYKPFYHDDGSIGVYYSCFSFDVINKCITSDDGTGQTQWTLGPPNRFSLQGKQPFVVRRGELKRGLIAP